MKKLFFILAFAFFAIFYVFAQELGIDVDQFLRLKKDCIEKTSDNDKIINRRHFVFKDHPDDPNYGALYTQDYEEEYFFINNKLYFIVKEYRAPENQWKNLLASYLNNYEYTERTNRTQDGSWYINDIYFYDEIKAYNVFIYRPSQRWNAIYKFDPGEALVRIVCKHYEYLKEYQSAYSAIKDQ
jgi:hypothetical protein